MFYIALALLMIQVIWLIFRFARKVNIPAQPPSPEFDLSNDYMDARSYVLGCRPGPLGLRDIAAHTVYAMVVESNSETGMEMLTANLLGEAAFFRFPEMLASDGMQPEILAKAIQLTTLTGGCTHLARPTNELNPPSDNMVKFFLLTPEDTLVLELPVGWPTDPREKEWTLVQMVNDLKTTLLRSMESKEAESQDFQGTELVTEVTKSAGAETQVRPEEGAPWPDSMTSPIEQKMAPELYLLQNGRERIITHLKHDEQTWRQRLNYFISVKTFRCDPASLSAVGLWCNNMDLLAEQLIQFQRQQEADFCVLTSGLGGQSQLEMVQLREDISSKVIQHLSSAWEFDLQEYEGDYYLSVLMPKEYTRAIRLSDDQAALFRDLGSQVVQDWVDDLRSYESKLYAEAIAEGRSDCHLDQMVLQMVVRLTDSKVQSISSEPTPLTVVWIDGQQYVFKGELSEQELASHFHQPTAWKTFLDLDELWATGDYVDENGDVRRNMETPGFQFFHSQPRHDGLLRLRSSLFPLLKVNGKVKQWLDFKFAYVERDGIDYMIAFKGGNPDRSMEIRLTQDHLRLIGKFGGAYLRQLADEMCQLESYEIERAQLDGRLVGEQSEGKATGHVMLKGEGMKFALERRVFTNPDSNDPKYWLRPYNDVQIIDFPCSICENNFGLGSNAPSASYTPDPQNIDMPGLMEMGPLGNLYQLLRCNSCRSYYLIGMGGFEPHNGHNVVALQTITLLTRLGITPEYTFDGDSNDGEIDEEQTAVLPLLPWKEVPFGSGHDAGKKVPVEVRFTSPWMAGKRTLNSTERSAIQFLHQNQREVQDAACKAIFHKLKEPQPWLYPQVDTPAELQHRIGLNRIVLLPESDNGTQCIGLELELCWNSFERATAVMCKGEVLYLGFGAAAIKWKTY